MFSPSLFTSASFSVTFVSGSILIKFLAALIGLKKSCIFLASDLTGIPVWPALNCAFDNSLPLLSTKVSSVVILSCALDILFAGMSNIILPISPSLLSITSLNVSPSFTLTVFIISFC